MILILTSFPIAQIKQCGGLKMEGWGSTFQRNGGRVQAGWTGGEK